ncbi:hypothetical protein GCM10022197_21120 [Microlunatus spumicola]|uniref:Uncharacterized protein n=1 Tax=Microlunatus spumicola TaxID=81499 RepID=A0ABP6XES4_9ACTN
MEAVLLDDAYAPITSRIGFLRAPLDEAAEGLRAWRAEIHGSARAEPLAGGLPDALGRLEPLTGGVRPRELLVATADPGWTAVFDCGVQGGDQTTTVGFLARRLMVQGVVVLSIPDRKASPGVPDRFGGRQLELFAPIATDFLNYVRTVSVVRDQTRWRFDANGTVQDFEDEDAYRRRKVADRFSPELLVAYAAALGLRPFDADFYPGPAVLVTNPATPPPGAAVVSLAEARRATGL